MIPSRRVAFLVPRNNNTTFNDEEILENDDKVRKRNTIMIISAGSSSRRTGYYARVPVSKMMVVPSGRIFPSLPRCYVLAFVKHDCGLGITQQCDISCELLTSFKPFIHSTVRDTVPQSFLTQRLKLNIETLASPFVETEEHLLFARRMVFHRFDTISTRTQHRLGALRVPRRHEGIQ